VWYAVPSAVNVHFAADVALQQSLPSCQHWQGGDSSSSLLSSSSSQCRPCKCRPCRCSCPASAGSSDGALHSEPKSKESSPRWLYPRARGMHNIPCISQPTHHTAGQHVVQVPGLTKLVLAQIESNHSVLPYSPPGALSCCVTT
jgi:hypothetical protein